MCVRRAELIGEQLANSLGYSKMVLECVVRGGRVILL
jgi:hypothetical protein